MERTQITTMRELQRVHPVGAQVAGVDLVALYSEDGVRVYAGRCPHQGTLLSEGHIEDGRLICPGHGWQFRCTNGAKIDDHQVCLQQFSVQIDKDIVWVDHAEIAAWEAKRRQTQGQRDIQALQTVEELPGPPGLPILGNLPQIKIEHFHLTLEAWSRKYGDICQFLLGQQRAIVVADPDLVHTFLQARPEEFARLSGIRQTIEEMGVQGLFSAEGKQWRRYRQIATRTFDVRHLQAFTPTMTKVTQRLLCRWQQMAAQRTPLDVQQELMRYTVDITTNLAFGYDMNTLEQEGDRIQQHLERIFPMIARRAFLPVRYWKYIKFPADRALDRSLMEVRVAVSQFISQARQQMTENPELLKRPQNLLQALLAAQADEAVELSDDEIFGNVFTFLLAGEDTTANTVAWIVYFMTQHPEIQRRMQEEADSVLAGEKTTVNYETLRELRYIEAVAHETMRLKPVATFLGLEALSDVTVGNLQIPQGTPVFVLLRIKGLEESEFAAAAEFRPERWMGNSRVENPHRRQSFLPFGAGPRLCPGRSLALMEIKMVMAMICHNFDVVRTEPDREIRERFVFTMMPEELLVSLHSRNHPVTLV